MVRLKIKNKHILAQCLQKKKKRENIHHLTWSSSLATMRLHLLNKTASPYQLQGKYHWHSWLFLLRSPWTEDCSPLRRPVPRRTPPSSCWPGLPCCQPKLWRCLDWPDAAAPWPKFLLCQMCPGWKQCGNFLHITTAKCLCLLHTRQ